MWGKPIYVQIDIDGEIDRLWELTQTPHLHREWDLRFTDIEYLPRDDDTQPQRFLYATRIGFGMRIDGKGETVGVRHTDDGSRSSALKFWSDDPKSLIREGSGYWKYIPLRSGDKPAVRFITGYDYQVRYGIIGRIFDCLIFRPIIGWATAWSFDRLRLWVETGTHPKRVMIQAATYSVARLLIAFTWIYHGLIPKLLLAHSEELRMMEASGLGRDPDRLRMIGVIEVAVGLATLVLWRWAWPLWFTLVGMIAATLTVAFASPSDLVMPFNAITFNGAVFGLTVIALLNRHDLPSARRCIRRLTKEKP